MLNRYNFASSSFEFSTFLSSRNAKKIACSPHFHLLHLSGVILQDYMLNQSYIYSRLKIPLISRAQSRLIVFIPGILYTRAYYYEALWHSSSLLKRFNSNNAYALYLTGFTCDIMFGCYKQKQRYVFWYEKWQKNIFQWGNPGERLSECVEGVEIYKINLKKKFTYLKSFMQRIFQKPILNTENTLRRKKGIALHLLPEWPLGILTTECMQWVGPHTTALGCLNLNN